NGDSDYPLGDLDLKSDSKTGTLDLTQTRQSCHDYYVNASSKMFFTLSPAKNTRSLGCFGWLLVLMSLLFVTATFPLTIFLCVKIVQEYERAVIFRLGRITDRKPKGPGLSLSVDLRTVSFDIPPQET
ncbi:hypothetical protein FQN60_004847, partial [Etheostoma spectabile]